MFSYSMLCSSKNHGNNGNGNVGGDGEDGGELMNVTMQVTTVSLLLSCNQSVRRHKPIAETKRSH